MPSQRAQGTTHSPHLEGHLHSVVHPFLQHKGPASQLLQVSCTGRGSISPVPLPLPLPLPLLLLPSQVSPGSPVRSMVMGPGACSHISVSFVTCTLGTLASGDKQQGPDLTHHDQPHHHLHPKACPWPCDGGKGHGVRVGGVKASECQAGHRRAGAPQVTPPLPFGVKPRLKDPDTGISQGIPFPGSGAGQGEAEEEDAARAAP